ncbi:MAG: hypothetical protein KBT27_00450, partial [Prevotellaceae bacterium]|nr:hypothetical protein [Candidatus Faecinaster equi]
NAMPAELKQKYIKDMKTEIDKRAQLKYAIETGLEEGRKRGMEIGRAEGKAEGRSEVARAMLDRGMDIALIADVTGLSAEQILAQ